MRNWMDLNGDGRIDGTEMMFAEEMLCGSREEHEALFGDAGDFEDNTEDDFNSDAMAAGLRRVIQQRRKLMMHMMMDMMTSIWMEIMTMTDMIEIVTMLMA